MQVKTEDRASYNVPSSSDEATENSIISRALEILESRMARPGECLSSPSVVRDYLRLKLAEYEHEVFAALWLDAQNRVIAYDELFNGTLTQAAVYPREVVKAALAHNSASVIFSHNHPSGLAEPSRADEMLTRSLKEALSMVDVRVLDHIIVGGATSMSFAERGLI